LRVCLAVLSGRPFIIRSWVDGRRLLIKVDRPGSTRCRTKRKAAAGCRSSCGYPQDGSPSARDLALCRAIGGSVRRLIRQLRHLEQRILGLFTGLLLARGPGNQRTSDPPSWASAQAVPPTPGGENVRGSGIRRDLRVLQPDEERRRPLDLAPAEAQPASAAGDRKDQPHLLPRVCGPALSRQAEPERFSAAGVMAKPVETPSAAPRSHLGYLVDAEVEGGEAGARNGSGWLRASFWPRADAQYR
jgi:hypothetical protein